jgi:hypothetical protein
MDRKQKDWNWSTDPDAFGKYSYEAAQLQVLMDVRDELKRLNNVLQCPNFIAVPSILRRVQEEVRQVKLNTRKKKRPKFAKPKLRIVG